MTGSTTTLPVDFSHETPRADATDIALRATVEVDEITKSFADKTVVANVSFSVRRGEFVALLGPSGAGKTTLIRCMAGLEVPDAGTVRLDGALLTSLARTERRRVAVVFQQFNLVSRLSALDNVLAGRLGHVPTWRGMLRHFSRDDRLLALECLHRVGLIDQAQQRADTLSGGQQQRVAIARALAQQPEVILADEPIASLDPQAARGILDLLRDICTRDRVAVVCCLHQLHFARDVADRIVGLAAGRLITDGPAVEFGDDAAARLYGASLT